MDKAEIYRENTVKIN